MKSEDQRKLNIRGHLNVSGEIKTQDKNLVKIYTDDSILNDPSRANIGDILIFKETVFINVGGKQGFIQIG